MPASIFTATVALLSPYLCLRQHDLCLCIVVRVLHKQCDVFYAPMILAQLVSPLRVPGKSCHSVELYAFRIVCASDTLLMELLIKQLAI